MVAHFCEKTNKKLISSRGHVYNKFVKKQEKKKVCIYVAYICAWFHFFCGNYCNFGEGWNVKDRLVSGDGDPHDRGGDLFLAHGIFSGFPEYDHADRGKIIAFFSVIGTCDRSVVALLFQGVAAGTGKHHCADRQIEHCCDSHFFLGISAGTSVAESVFRTACDRGWNNASHLIII